MKSTYLHKLTCLSKETNKTIEQQNDKLNKQLNFSDQ